MGRKVIISRKGFDGTTGGKPSPIIDNKFISLPIPRADWEIFIRILFTHHQRIT
ncbi:Nmad3 family putative nucleotide modification protein [Lysinibacillus capsici]